MDEALFKKKIGIRIRRLRTIRGWSRQQAADKLEMSVTGYGNIERGETDVCITRLAHISEVFDIPLQDLMRGEEKSIFISKNHFQGTYNLGNFNSTVVADDLVSKKELEKSQFTQRALEKEIANLKQQIAQLNEIIILLRNRK